MSVVKWPSGELVGEENSRKEEGKNRSSVLFVEHRYQEPQEESVDQRCVKVYPGLELSF